MRVVHAYKIFKPEVEGGIPEVIDILSRGLATHGHHNDIIVARGQGWSQSEASPNIRVERCFSFGNVLSLPMAPSYPLRLREAVKGADIVALHAPFPLADPVVATLPRATGLVVHWHSDIVRQKRSAALLAPLRRRMLDRADEIIVTHDTMVDQTEALQPYRQKVMVVPYGIDVERWQLTTIDDDMAVSALRRAFPTLFVTVGRLVTYKGFDVLLKAMCLVEGHLIICGEGPEGDRLKSLARELGIAERVTFVGKVPVEQIRRYLKAATCFVFPSVTAAETFGIVQLEAMAAGLPIINTALPTTVPHIARHDQEALTVPPRDAAALQAAMTLIASDEALRRRLAAAASHRVKTYYSEARFVERILGFYDVLHARLARL